MAVCEPLTAIDARRPRSFSYRLEQHDNKRKKRRKETNPVPSQFPIGISLAVIVFFSSLRGIFYLLGYIQVLYLAVAALCFENNPNPEPINSRNVYMTQYKPLSQSRPSSTEWNSMISGDDSFAFQSCGSCLDSATDVRLSNCCRSIKSWGRARLFAIYLFPLSSTRDPDRIFWSLRYTTGEQETFVFLIRWWPYIHCFHLFFFVYFLGSQKRQNKSWLTEGCRRRCSTWTAVRPVPGRLEKNHLSPQSDVHQLDKNPIVSSRYGQPWRNPSSQSKKKKKGEIIKSR